MASQHTRSPHLVELQRSPSMDQEETVYVTHVESPTSFWAQSADLKTIDVINKISTDLQLFCKNKPLLQTAPLVNKIYGGMYSEDNLWYRCRIKEMIEQDLQIQVHFIDYGNTEVISKRSLVFLSQDLLSPKPFSQLYCLHGLSPPEESSKLFHKGLQYLRELTDSKIIHVKLMSRRRTPELACQVEVTDSVVGDIGMEMKRWGFASKNYTPSSSPCSTPIKRSSPPLASPTPSFTYDKNNNVEDVRKENMLLRDSLKGLQQVIENLKSACKMQNEKHCYEIRHTVTCKFKKLIHEATLLRNLRKSYPEEGNVSDVISTAISQVKDKSKCITMTDMKSLDKVIEAEKGLSASQEAIKTCSDQDVLLELIKNRNRVQQDLSDAISAFLLHLGSLPLDSRLIELQISLGQLMVQSEGFSAIGGQVSTDEAIELYESWIEKSREALCEVQAKTKKNCIEVCSGLEKVQQVLSNDDCAVDTDIVDLDEVIDEYMTAIQQEADKTKSVQDDEGEVIRAQVIKALVSEMSSELADIKELRENLHRYKNFKDELDSRLASKPDVTKVTAAKKSIRSLRSKLRHKLADKQDLEESDDPEDSKALQEVEEALSKLYRQLHRSYLEEHRELEVLSKMAEYMPELPMLHPELVLTNFMATNGLVKVGWEVDHFPNYGTNAWTEFDGEPCLLKKYRLDDAQVSGREEFQTQAVMYSRVSDPRLVKLQALFYDKSKRKAFIQTRYFESLEQWLESCREEKELSLVSEDILRAVTSLHSHGFTHGAISEDTVRVTQCGGVTRAVLANPDFTKPLAHSGGHDMEERRSSDCPLILQDLDSVAVLRAVLDRHAKSRPPVPQATECQISTPDVVTASEKSVTAVHESKSDSTQESKPEGQLPNTTGDPEDTRKDYSTMKDPLHREEKRTDFEMPPLQPIDEAEELPEQHSKVMSEKAPQLEEKQNGDCPR